MWENPFKKDDRVTLKPGVKKRGARHGVIATKPRSHNLVCIIWDGTKSLSTYHVDFLERAAVSRS